jgi:hypothetical protein
VFRLCNTTITQRNIEEKISVGSTRKIIQKQNKRRECLHEISYTQKVIRWEKEKKIHNLISQTAKSQLEDKKSTDKEEIQGAIFQQKIPDE